MKAFSFFVIFSIISFSTMQSQSFHSVISTAGETSKLSSQLITWVIGQSFYETSSSESITFIPSLGAFAYSFESEVDTTTQHGDTTNTRSLELGQVRLFPNPAKSSFQIEVGAEWLPNTQVVILNELGNLVLSNNLQSQSTYFSTNKLISGFYFVRIQNSNGVSKVIRLIINK